jgi:LysM repeat protein
MNTNSPLLPQGTTPPRQKSTLLFKVLMIVSIHVVVIGGMLLQGCKDTAKESKDTSASPNGTETGYTANSNNTAETAPAATLASVSNGVAALPAQQMGSQPVSTAPATTAPAALQPALATGATAAAPVATTPPTGESHEYVIVAGDTFGALARRNHVSLKAMTDANPGVDAKKLKIGQKVQIPATTSAIAAASPGPAPSVEAVDADGSLYVVKSGDTLGKIARLHGTTFKKIMAMNDLKTTSIRVGQKLKLPGQKPAAVDATPAPASTPAAQPQPSAAAPASTPTPMGAAN